MGSRELASQVLRHALARGSLDGPFASDSFPKRLSEVREDFVELRDRLQKLAATYREDASGEWTGRATREDAAANVEDMAETISKVLSDVMPPAMDYAMDKQRLAQQLNATRTARGERWRGEMRAFGVSEEETSALVAPASALYDQQQRDEAKKYRWDLMITHESLDIRFEAGDLAETLAPQDNNTPTMSSVMYQAAIKLGVLFRGHTRAMLLVQAARLARVGATLTNEGGLLPDAKAHEWVPDARSRPGARAAERVVLDAEGVAGSRVDAVLGNARSAIVHAADDAAAEAALNELEDEVSENDQLSDADRNMLHSTLQQALAQMQECRNAHSWAGTSVDGRRSADAALRMANARLLSAAYLAASEAAHWETYQEMSACVVLQHVMGIVVAGAQGPEAERAYSPVAHLYARLTQPERQETLLELVLLWTKGAAVGPMLALGQHTDEVLRGELGAHAEWYREHAPSLLGQLRDLHARGGVASYTGQLRDFTMDLVATFPRWVSDDKMNAMAKRAGVREDHFRRELELRQQALDKHLSAVRFRSPDGDAHVDAHRSAHMASEDGASRYDTERVRTFLRGRGVADASSLWARMAPSREALYALDRDNAEVRRMLEDDEGLLEVSGSSENSELQREREEFTRVGRDIEQSDAPLEAAERVGRPSGDTARVAAADEVDALSETDRRLLMCASDATTALLSPAAEDDVPTLSEYAWALSMLGASKWLHRSFYRFTEVCRSITLAQGEVLRNPIATYWGAMRAMRSLSEAIDHGHAPSFAAAILERGRARASAFSGLFTLFERNGDLGFGRAQAAIQRMGYAVDPELRSKGRGLARRAESQMEARARDAAAIATAMRERHAHGSAFGRLAQLMPRSSAHTIVHYLAAIMQGRQPGVEDAAAMGPQDDSGVVDAVVRAVERKAFEDSPVRSDAEGVRGSELPAEAVGGARLAGMSAFMQASADMLGHAEYTELPFDPGAVGAPKHFDVLASRMAVLTHRVITALAKLAAAGRDEPPHVKTEGLSLDERAKMERVPRILVALERVVEDIGVIYAEMRKRGSAYVPERVDHALFYAGDAEARTIGWLQGALVTNAGELGSLLRVIRSFAVAEPPARQ